MKLWLISLLLLVCTQSRAWSEWTPEQRQWYVASNVLLLADWSTTRDMTRRYNEGYRELNPILGSRPSTDKLDLDFVTVLIGHYFATDYFKGRDREIYLYTITAVEGAAVTNNLNIGLRLRF